jgi:zinc protease
MMVIKTKYYSPNNSILVIGGDVKHEDAFTKAKAIFGNWESSGSDPILKYPIPEFKPLAATQYFVMESTLAQTPVELYFWEGPDTRYDSAGTIAANVFCTILGLNSSKWNQALVDKGLASQAGVNYQTERYVGPIQIYIMPNPSKIKECNDEILNQISQWGKADYFTDEQLKDAKATILRNKIREKERPSAQTNILTYYWTSASLDYMTDFEKNCQKITREDIVRFVDKYITGKSYIAGMVISPDMNKKSGASDSFKPVSTK